jgi:hypothetical protein
MVGVFDRSTLCTAIAIERGPMGIRRIVGPALLRDGVREPALQLAARHQQLRRAAEQVMGPLALACSVDQAVLRGLLSRPSRGALASARRRGQLVLEPAPAAVAWLLALDSALGGLWAPSVIRP